MNNKNKTPAATGASEPFGIEFELKASQLFGACLIRPSLSHSIPIAIHSLLSPYGLFILKACSEGWGIEGIRLALDSFGLDGNDIISACLNAVHGDPARTFWAASRHLCEVPK